MTYIVSSGALNSTQSISEVLQHYPLLLNILCVTFFVTWPAK